MWPFKKKISEKELREFKEYVSGGTLANIGAHPGAFPSAERQTRQFLLLQVKDDVLGDIQGHLTEVLGELTTAECIVETVMSSFVLAEVPPEADAASLAQSLLRGRERWIRAVHGTSDALRGFVGCGTFFSYGSLIPNFSSALNGLLSLDFGSSRAL